MKSVLIVTVCTYEFLGKCNNDSSKYLTAIEQALLLKQHLLSVYTKLKNQDSNAYIIFHINEYALSNGYYYLFTHNSIKTDRFITQEQKNSIKNIFSKFTATRECSIFLPLLHKKIISTIQKAEKLILRRSSLTNKLFIENRCTILDGLQIAREQSYNIIRDIDIINQCNKPITKVSNTVYVFSNGKCLAKRRKINPYSTDVYHDENIFCNSSFFEPGDSAQVSPVYIDIDDKQIPFIVEVCFDHHVGMLNKKYKNSQNISNDLVIHLVSAGTVKTRVKHIVGDIYVHADLNHSHEKVYVNSKYYENVHNFQFTFYSAPIEGELTEHFVRELEETKQEASKNQPKVCDIL